MVAFSACFATPILLRPPTPIPAHFHLSTKNNKTRPKDNLSFSSRPRFVTVCQRQPLPQPSPTDPVRSPALLKQYRLVNLVQRTPPFLVFHAVDTNDAAQTPLHLKLVSLRSLPDWAPLDSLRSEARVLPSLDHPAIPRFIDAFDYDVGQDTIFVLVTSQPRGDPLHQYPLTNTRLTASDAYALLRQLLDVLDYLTTVNPPLLHRHITPHTLYIAPPPTPASTPQLTLTSFAAAHNPFAPPDTRALLAISPPSEYTAPEHLSEHTDRRVDLYSGAACFVLLLTGMTPSSLPRDSVGAVDVRTAFSYARLDAQRALVGVLAAMLQPLAQDRPSSAAAAAEMLQEEARAHDVQAPQRGRANASIVGSAGSLVDTRMPRTTGRSAKRPIAVGRDKGGRRLTVTMEPVGVNSATVSRAVFAAVWTTFTAVWTVGVVSAGGAAVGMALFSVPFWRAGAKMATGSLREMRGRAELELERGGDGDGDGDGDGVATLRTRGGVGEEQELRGSLLDLERVEVEDGGQDGDGVGLVVWWDSRPVQVISGGIEEEDARRVCYEINSFLRGYEK